jgi:putative nucleotidyltransferase with HDIG domain
MARATKTRKKASPRHATSDNGAPPRTRGLGGGGHRLAEAFTAVERLPVLAESQRRLRALTAGPSTSEAEVTETVEADVGLVIAVLRGASNGNSAMGPVRGVGDAVAALTPEGVGRAAEALDGYELFEPPAEWHGQLEPLRRHSVATKHAALRVAELGGRPNWDALALAAMLHDVGILVLARLYPGYTQLAEYRAGSPEERVQAERRELGIDHALVGSVLTRRWGVPAVVTTTVERHHATDVEGAPAVIALADQVAHHSHGDPVSAERMSDLAPRAGLDDEALGSLLYEFPHSHTLRGRAPEPCPLSGRELDAVRGLAQGKVYKEIADDLSLSASTVRTHLHNVYRKVGAIDRAQAVLIARDRGWI